MELTKETMYNALINRDKSFEGVFFIGVKTTGIFCRPTCNAKKPKFENVEFFQNPKDAILNGYRPCKICEPIKNAGEIPEVIKKIIDKINENPFEKIKDGDLLKFGIEPNTIRRWFKKNHGITFHAYQRMIRINSAFNHLKNGTTTTETAFETGFESLSGFNEAFKKITGINPSKAKYNNIINIKQIATPIGPMYACATDEGLCLLEFTDRRMLEFELKQITTSLKAKIVFGNHAIFDILKIQLDEYFAGKRKLFDIKLNSPGTDFQKKVWNGLMQIPYGTTRSYKQQAIILNNPNGVRAVAKANGYNRISIIIPCHRVIGDNGDLTGYGGGLWRKKWLIDFEKKNF